MIVDSVDNRKMRRRGRAIGRERVDVEENRVERIVFESGLSELQVRADGESDGACTGLEVCEGLEAGCGPGLALSVSCLY